MHFDFFLLEIFSKRLLGSKRLMEEAKLLMVLRSGSNCLLYSSLTAFEVRISRILSMRDEIGGRETETETVGRWASSSQPVDPV